MAPCNRVPARSAKLADVVAPKPNTTAGKKRVYMSKDQGLQGGSREFPRIQAIRIVRVIGAPCGASGGPPGDSAGQRRRRLNARPARKWRPDTENMHVHHLVLLLASLHRMEKRGSIP